jgi:hypothetical protein
VDILITLLVVVVVAAAAFALYRAITSSTFVVPQEERRVIYRLGQFHRVVGPGVVRIYPKLDKVQRIYEVREHPVEVEIDGIFAFLVPNTFTLNLWVRTDPVEAAGRDGEMLSRLVQIREVERQDQVKVKMREALVKQVSELQKRFPLPDYATTFDGVIAFAPGSARYNALLDGVTQTLRHSLPTIGVILSIDQPITLTRRAIPDDIVEALGQKRGIDISGQTLIQYATQLRTAFPNMSDAILSQILGSIPGVDMSNIRPLIMEQTGKFGAKVEYEMHEDGTGQVNLQPDVETPAARPVKPLRMEPSATDHKLSDSDLSVLKRIPHRQDRKSA